MKIYIASDHVGFLLKKAFLKYLEGRNFEVVDLGPSNDIRMNYTDSAKKLCEKLLIEKSEHKGVLICGTGVGMSMAANKFKGIRAALCTNEYMAKMTIQHNNANVLCLGSRVIGEELAKSILDAFLSAKFEGGRHLQRVIRLDQLCDI